MYKGCFAPFLRFCLFAEETAELSARREFYVNFTRQAFYRRKYGELRIVFFEARNVFRCERAFKISHYVCTIQLFRFVCASCVVVLFDFAPDA